MHLLILVLFLVLLIYGPSLWVRHIIHKHSKPVENMPGTGAELARHLIERFELTGVEVKPCGPGQDHYSPEENAVALSPLVYDGRSVSAVAIATHEVSHAIQYQRQETVSRLRKKYTGLAMHAQRVGIATLSLAPVLGVATRAPAVIVLLMAAGLIAMLGSVALYAMILPEEYDASFGKALPILEEGYLPPELMPAARDVLKAAALTYVAGALANTLSIWRWLAVLR